MSLGAVPIEPITGRWLWGDCARLRGLEGATWERVSWLPRPDLEQKYGASIVASYREMTATNARHLYVFAGARFVIDHRDEVNPNLRYGLEAPIRHLAADVPGGQLLAAGAVVGGVTLGGFAIGKLLGAIFGGEGKKWDSRAQRYRGKKSGRFTS